MEGLMIRRLRPEEQFPMSLLLLADPSQEVVESYIHRGKCFVAELNCQIVGVYVLIDTRPQTVELVNVAVMEEEQGKGIGKRLVTHAIHSSRSMAYKAIELGTGNRAIGTVSEVWFSHRRCGFGLLYTALSRTYL